MTNEPAAAVPRRPYVGLRPFDYADHEFFFGRGEQINALYQLVDASSFVAVIGSSGGGKSSLVRAGLLPILDKETADEDAGRQWVWRVMQPGDAPLDHLIDELAGLCTHGEAGDLAERRARIGYHIRRSSYGLADALREIEELRGKTLLLVVDQFEELFRFASQTRRSLSAIDSESRAAERLRTELRKEGIARDAATQFVQILLEADRDPTLAVRVLITMRSDFIGDCARYRDLPEAVSASQFLTPGLKRSQLEDVIRKPAEMFGATIELELVEQLLLDSDDENDQLPVLQHCLSRIWSRASQRESSARNLTLDDYERVGRLDRALSQHADELMNELPGLKVAVEQTFRALAELDGQGRGIRRALPYAQLRDEVGVSEADLNKVLERFRADDCSFLAPSLSSTPTLSPSSRIDVGHEALLRRWDKVNGVAGAADEAEAGGWLRSEARDRQRYGSLLGWLDNQRAGGDGVPPNLIEREVRWWGERPRTPAWAKRYGGQFDEVERLLTSSQEALVQAGLKRKRAKRMRRAWVAAAIVTVVGLSGLWAYEQKRTEIKLRALTDAQFVVTQKILEASNSGDLNTKGAMAILGVEANILEKYGDTPDYQLLLANMKFTSSDIYQHAGDFDKALADAKGAQDVVRKLIEAQPNNGLRRHLDYSAWSRVASILYQTLPVGAKETREAYDQAMSAIEKALELEPNNPDWRMDEVIQLGHMGVALGSPEGDKLLQDSLDKMRALIRINPTRPDFRRELANAVQRVGRAGLDEAKGDKNQLEQVAELFDEAILIRQALVRESPGDNVYESNLSSNYVDLSKVAEARGNYDAAEQDLNTVIQRETALVKKDPDYAQWRVYLASHYGLMIDLLRDECQKGCEASRNAAMTQRIRLDFSLEIELRQDVASRTGAGRSALKTLAERVRDFLGYMKSLDTPSWSDEEVKAALATCQFSASADAAPVTDNPDAFFALSRLDLDAVDAVSPSHANAAEVHDCLERSAKALELADTKMKSDPRWSPLHDDAKTRLAALGATPAPN